VRLVGAFLAKNKLGQLLDLVEQGEEVTITRHGKEVARLVRPCGPSAAGKRPGPPFGVSASAPNNASSGVSTGRNGNPTGTKAASESCAQQLGNARLDLQRGDHGADPPPRWHGIAPTAPLRRPQRPRGDATLSATKWLRVRTDFAILIRNQEVAYEQ
jgi:antitoxin (DNA-binding transcriptional repressor) of toxin-antitoxin stability system